MNCGNCGDFLKAPDQLAAYARQIAIYRAYPVLENGLQPLADCEVNGVVHQGLISKFEHEQEEFKDAVANKDIWHQYHEAADLLYYAACIASQVVSNKTGNYYPLSWYSGCLSKFDCMFLYNNAGFCGKNAEKAALAKYGWRSASPENADPANKNEESEIELIKKTVQASC